MAEGEEMLVVPREVHDAIFTAAFLARGFDESEASAATAMAALATQHGIRSVLRCVATLELTPGPSSLALRVARHHSLHPQAHLHDI
jgi:hypothetical protein